MKRIRRPSPGTAIAIAALVIALGGAAFAAIPDSNGTIHGCYQKNNGDLRVVESASDCRPSEQSIDWNRQGPPGEASGVKVLPSITLDQGDRRLLFHAGSLTFTAFCRPVGADPNDSDMRAVVELTTSQDHAAVVVDFGRFAQRDVLTGQTAIIPGAGSDGTFPAVADVDFTATSPDRTVVTGIFSLNANVGNDPGKCLIGGHVAVSQ